MDGSKQNFTDGSAGMDDPGCRYVECYYKEVGCPADPMPLTELQQHIDQGTKYHLQLLTTAYNRVSTMLQRRHSQDMLQLQSANSQWQSALNPFCPELDLDDYQFRRQRSWECGRFSRKLSYQQLRRHESHDSLSAHRHMLQDPMPVQQQADPWIVQTLAPTDGSEKNTQCNTDKLLKEMYQRLVQLEQKATEQEIRMDRLSSQLGTAMNLVADMTKLVGDFTVRNCNGSFVWRIPHFTRERNEMMNNPAKVIYSPSFYTEPFGYKFCGRINVHTAEEPFLSLHVHVVQGEFDSFQSWPFQGSVTFNLKNMSANGNDATDTVLSKRDASAFQRPVSGRNPIGYGFDCFCPLQEILSGGFLKDDTLYIHLIIQKSSGQL